jgi:hypothetical protein
MISGRNWLSGVQPLELVDDDLEARPFSPILADSTAILRGDEL